MGADKNATIVPGHGTLFIADSNTALPGDNTNDILSAFSLLGDPPDGWENIGHTSKDNQPAFTKDGGDKTVLDTWLVDNVDVVYSSTQWGLGINALQLDELGLDLAFGGSFDTDGGYIIPASNDGQEKAGFLFMTDGTGSCGFYMPNSSYALGDAPSIDASKFMELPLSATILTVDDDVIPAAANGLSAIMKLFKNGLVISPPAITSLSVSTGAAGDLVEIFGRGFTGATGAGGVKFGATNAGVGEYTVVDDKHIVVIVPAASSGSTPITVITTAGTSNAEAFTHS
jgi:hypothetical protein